MKKAILVGVNLLDDLNFEEEMKELKGLASACEFKVEGILTQNAKIINKKYYIGAGKIELLKNFSKEHQTDIIIFNNDLSSLQNKNLEDELEIEVIDRTLLILNIFSKRAKSKEAKLQVEVARLKYLLPRLVVSNANYEQQGGGSLHNKGAGEKQIDIDKRILRQKISMLEHELDNIEKTKSTQRKKREKNLIPLVSLVGYTNAGKSTLMNTLINKNSKDIKDKTVLAKDMLFATLDTTTRLIKYKDNKNYILSDTVGFISKLPTELIRAFKSTLNEILNADLILLVADVSSDEIINQIDVTLNTLKEIGVSNDIPIIKVYNKVDKANFNYVINNENEILISAKNNYNIDYLEEKIKSILYSNWKKINVFIPYEDSKYPFLLSLLLRNYNVISMVEEEYGIKIEAEVSPIDYENFLDYLCK